MWGATFPMEGLDWARLRQGWSLHRRAAAGGGGEGAAASSGSHSLGTPRRSLRAPPWSYPLVLHGCSPARPGPARGPRWLFLSPSWLCAAGSQWPAEPSPRRRAPLQRSITGHNAQARPPPHAAGWEM